MPKRLEGQISLGDKCVTFVPGSLLVEHRKNRLWLVISSALSLAPGTCIVTSGQRTFLAGSRFHKQTVERLIKYVFAPRERAVTP